MGEIMKLYYSKSFVAVLIFMMVLFILGFVAKLPLWISILLFAPIAEFTFHEYVHAFVAWIYGIKTEYIICNFSTMCCRFEPILVKKQDIYYRIVFSGALFQSAIHSFEITILVLSGLFLNNIIPFFFAGAFLFKFILYDILPDRCDLMRTINYKKNATFITFKLQ